MEPTPVALVTGGSRGIGRGICIALANAGYAVAVNYAGNAEAARQTLDLLTAAPEAAMFQADIADDVQRARLVESVLDRWGRIDVLVNNAGIASPGRRDLLEATPDAWEQVMRINLRGPFFLTQSVARQMLRQSPSRCRPCIINISSISAYTASVSRGDYCIAKAGLSMLTKLFALRLAESGIGVFEVRPGIIDTDMIAAVRERYAQRIADGLTPIRRFGTPEDVGAAVALLATGRLAFSTGEVLNVDGGYHLRSL
jgi:NAD(P)-dependent dehydrogenase (short-subunit alcohol dehydrogenase family)